MLFPRTAMIALGTALTLVSPSQAQTTLRYRFKEGDKLHLQTDAKSFGKATTGGETIKRENSYLVDTVLTASGVDKEGRCRFTQKIERIRLKADYLGLPIEYDSQAKKEPE